MGKVVAFISKWGFVIALCLVATALLFALGSTIYIATKNAFVGIVGTIGVAIALTSVVGEIYSEIRDIKSE